MNTTPYPTNQLRTPPHQAAAAKQSDARSDSLSLKAFLALNPRFIVVLAIAITSAAGST